MSFFLMTSLGTLELLSEMLVPNGGVLLGNQLFAPVAPSNDMAAFQAGEYAWHRIVTPERCSGGGRALECVILLDPCICLPQWGMRRVSGTSVRSRLHQV